MPIVFDSLGGAIGSAVLAAMGAGSAFVGYGLLSGQNVRSSAGVAAACRRSALAQAGRPGAGKALLGFG